MMLVNGARAESIPLTDRGLAYGDGVFRTLRVVDGRPLHWDQHYAKLYSDCDALGLLCPPKSVLLSETRSAATGIAHASVKIIVTRGSGPRGYAPPQPCACTRVVIAEARAPLLRNETGVNVRLCGLRLAQQPALAGIKHLNRLENVLARAEWNDTAIDEGLLLDQGGDVIGGTMSNLFIVENGMLVTPDLSLSGVAGVTRARVIDYAKAAGIACRIEKVPLQRVFNADDAFLVNSLIGLWPVCRLADRRWDCGALTLQIRARMEAEDAAGA